MLACRCKQSSQISKLEALNNFKTHITFKYESILKLVILFVLLNYYYYFKKVLFE